MNFFEYQLILLKRIRLKPFLFSYLTCNFERKWCWNLNNYLKLKYQESNISEGMKTL